MSRARLRRAAHRIAALRGQPPAPPWVALRKLVIQERRDWTRPDAPRVGWKRGELVEWAAALFRRDFSAAEEEWGDIGYYVAQVGAVAWSVYRLVTPGRIIQRAVAKFERRARERRLRW